MPIPSMDELRDDLIVAFEALRVQDPAEAADTAIKTFLEWTKRSSSACTGEGGLEGLYGLGKWG